MLKKLLVVDDEPELLEVIKEFFVLEGWAVDTALNGAEGLWKQDSFRPDVILSDIRMPIVDGLEFLAELSKRDVQTPFIFLSAFGNFEKMKKAWGYGAFDFLEKPFSQAELLLLVENAFTYGKDYTRLARQRHKKSEVKKVIKVS